MSTLDLHNGKMKTAPAWPPGSNNPREIKPSRLSLFLEDDRLGLSYRGSWHTVRLNDIIDMAGPLTVRDRLVEWIDKLTAASISSTWPWVLLRRLMWQ